MSNFTLSGVDRILNNLASPNSTSISTEVNFNWQYFYQFLFLFINFCIASFLQAQLFVQCLQYKLFVRHSTCLLMNIGFCTVHAGFGIIYTGSTLLKMGQVKNGHIMFLINATMGGITLVNSGSKMMLMVDRILALSFPIGYRQNYARFVVFKFFFSITMGVIYWLLHFITEWPVPELTTCDVDTCLQKFGGFRNSVMKILVGVATLGVSIVFYVSVRKYMNSAIKQYQMKNINLVCGATVASEVVLLFLPQFIKAGSAWTGLKVWQSLGPYASICGGLEVLITAILYRVLIRRPRHETISSQNVTVY